jgi:hypothetical protein
MTGSRQPATGTTHVLPFLSLSPADFERLCLGLVQRMGYEGAEHLGASGSDDGCDHGVSCRPPGGLPVQTL